MAPLPQSEQYQPKDALAAAGQGTLVMGSAGALLSAVQNSLAKQNIGAIGFITRTGGTIGLFGAFNAISSTDGSHFLQDLNISWHGSNIWRL